MSHLDRERVDAIRRAAARVNIASIDRFDDVCGRSPPLDVGGDRKRTPYDARVLMEGLSLVRDSS